MLAKFTLPEMEKIFSSDNRYQLMTDVSVLICEALADIGSIPKEAYEEIRDKADYDMHRISELESETRNRSLAFLANLTEKIGPAARYLQMGVCSVDIADTVTSLQLRQACDLLQSRMAQLRQLLGELAHEYKYTLMLGRTHGAAAEPITFGLKLASWVREMERDLIRLRHARSSVTVGKMSGAVGSFSNIDPHVETFVCRRLSLQPAYVTGQSFQRDRMAEFMSTLAIIGGSLERFATEIRNLERTEIDEVEESSAEGEQTSTNMPHKQRPFETEIICGLSRVLRGYASTAFEDMSVWHEYDATHAQAEQIVVPDACELLDYMLWSFNNTMKTLRVYPENMRKNIDDCLGLVFSQRVMLALMDKGVLRDAAYEMVNRNASIAMSHKQDFQFLVLEDEEIRRYLSHRDIMELFDYDCFRHHVDYIFARADI